MKEQEKNISGGQLFTSLIYLALGICLVAFPGEAVNVICKIVFGIVLMLTGLYHIWVYLSEEGGTSIFNLFTGAILLVLGVFFFQNPQIVKMILPSLLAALLLVDSIWTLRAGLRLKKYERGEWKFFVAVSLLFVTLGIILFINPFSDMKYTIIFAGCSFIGDAFLDFVSMILAFRGNRAIRKTEVQTLPAENTKTEKKRKFLPLLGKSKKNKASATDVSVDIAEAEVKETKNNVSSEDVTNVETSGNLEETKGPENNNRNLKGLFKKRFGRKKEENNDTEQREVSELKEDIASVQEISELKEEPGRIQEAYELKEEPDRVQEAYELKEEPDRIQEVFELKEEPDRVQEVFELKEEPDRVQEVFELKEEPDLVQEVFELKEEPDLVQEVFELKEEPDRVQDLFGTKEEKDHLQNLLKLDEDALEEWKD